MTTADQPSDSLLEAMAKARIPAENHEFIRRVTTAIGIAEYRAVVRPYYGYTNGFTSEHEIVRIAGSGAERARSSRKGTWYVEHPTNRVRLGGEGERSRDIRREAGFCSCGMQLSLTGVCGNCD
jgi:hypothetical protein